jgi:hypothetical protein
MNLISGQLLSVGLIDDAGYPVISEIVHVKIKGGNVIGNVPATTLVGRNT